MSLRIDELDFVEVGDKLVVTARVKARGRGSEVTVRADYISVYEMHGGEVARMEIYFDRTKALEPWGCGSRRCRRAAGVALVPFP